ncbi:unnamed protein product, partial [Pleuronectes platessa]
HVTRTRNSQASLSYRFKYIVKQHENYSRNTTPSHTTAPRIDLNFFDTLSFREYKITPRPLLTSVYDQSCSPDQRLQNSQPVSTLAAVKVTTASCSRDTWRFTNKLP